MTDRSTDDLTEPLAGPVAAAHHAVSRRRTRRGVVAPAGPALCGRPGRRLHSRGDVGRRHVASRGRTRAAGDGDAQPSYPAAAPPADPARPVRRLHREAAGCAGRDGGLADRRLSDREPLLHPALAARPGAAFHRARRSRLVADRALQHPLPHRASASPTRRCCSSPCIRTSSA